MTLVLDHNTIAAMTPGQLLRDFYDRTGVVNPSLAELSSFYDVATWDPGKHPRTGKGETGGGQFTSGGGSSGTSGGSAGGKSVPIAPMQILASMSPEEVLSTYREQSGDKGNPTLEKLATFFGLDLKNISEYSYGHYEGAQYVKNPNPKSAEQEAKSKVSLAQSKAEIEAQKSKPARPAKSVGEYKSFDDGVKYQSEDSTVASPDSLKPLLEKQGKLNDVADVLGEYSANSEDINLSLRTEGKVEKNKDVLDKFDAQFAKASLPESMVVFRGVDGDGWDAISKTLKKNAVIEDKGFVSTSARLQVAKFFNGEVESSESGYLMQILIPQGAKALLLSGVSSHPGEAEVLLNRGTKFKVVSKNGSKVTLEVVK